MNLKITCGKELELTEEIAEAVSMIIKNLFMSVSDNYVICDINTFKKVYDEARLLFIHGEIKVPTSGLK